MYVPKVLEEKTISFVEHVCMYILRSFDRLLFQGLS